jgi:hypothetical protein
MIVTIVTIIVPLTLVLANGEEISGGVLGRSRR